MDILERIIENLTSDEVRRFKILSNRFKADEEKKLLVLFDAIRAGDYKENEDDVIKHFYGNTGAKSKNSYYRLRNKLLSNLEKSLLFYHFNYKNSIESFSNIQLSILFRERGLYREAFHNLKKAEKVALKQDQFNVLEIIYDEMVKLSIHFDVNIDKVLERRRENLKKIEILRANSEVLGMIHQQLTKRNYARGKRTESVIDTLEGIKDRLEEHKDIFQSPSGKIMIMKTVVTILIQKSAYAELVDYVKDTFDLFETNKLFNKDNHHIRLTMRVWRINALLKMLRLRDAREDIMLLREEVKMFKKQNYNEFAFYYFGNNAYTLKLLGELDKASKTLDDAFNQKEVLQNEVYEMYLLLSRADQYFSQEMYQEAGDLVKKVTGHPGFKYLDEEVKLYVRIFEIVNSYEAEDYQYADKVYSKAKRSFRALLRDDFFKKPRKFLDIIMRLNTAAIEGKNVFLRAAYRGFISEFPPSEIGDNQIILYEIYLQAKLENKSYYRLLVNKVTQSAI